MEKKIVGWNPINERIMSIDLKINGRDIRIFGIYAPTDDSDTNTKENFFEKLTEELMTTKNNVEIIILGDLNGRVGKALDSKIIGRHGEDVVNDNGSRWIELCEQHSLQILNGFFQHKNIHKYTWIQKTKNLKSVIDYVIIKQNTCIKPYDVKVWRGAECGSDHFLVKAPMKIKHRANPQENVTKEVCNIKELKRYNIEGLNDESTSFLYKLRLELRIANGINGTAEEMYEELKNKIHEAALESLGPRRKTKPRNFWWKEELLELIEGKKQWYLKWLATKDDEVLKQYNRYRYMVKKEVTKAKNEAWNIKCAQINSMIGGSRSREAWNAINNLKKNTNERRKISAINIKTWEDYYYKLLTESRDEYLNLNLTAEETANKVTEPITVEEVKDALRKMKNNRSPGPGDLPIELIKHATSTVFGILSTIFNKCLLGDKIPEDWKISFMNSIYKKGSRDKCENYRGISVTSSVGKLYGRILNARIEKEIVEKEEQNGFRPGRSCIDNIFTLRHLVEKLLAKGRELHVAFIDLSKAFDSVPFQKLWEAMANTEISQVYINAVKAIYRENKNVVIVGNQISAPFCSTKGVKQGCCLSPTLFRIYQNEALKQWIKKCSPMGIQIDNRPIYTVLYADDQIVVAEDQQDMQYMLAKLTEEYNKWGLQLNMEKTQYMVIGGRSENIELESGTIKNTDTYDYLGVTISEDGRDKMDIMRKVGKSKKMIKMLHPILWNKNLTNKTKKNIFKTMIEPVMTYGSEVWVMDTQTEKKLLSTEMMYWRRSCRLTLRDRVRNERIREEMETNGTVLDTIKEKQMKWYGHLRRMEPERIPLRIWNWKPKERNKRGRPRKRWIKDIRQRMEEIGLQEEDWMDRDLWRLGCEKRQ